jgi:anti-anti-sigma factor
MLNITVTGGGPSPALVTLDGESDLTTAGELALWLDAARLRNPRNITVDARRLTFADVATVRVLLTAARAARRGGGQLVLSGPAPIVARVVGLLDHDHLIIVDPGPPGPDLFYAAGPPGPGKGTSTTHHPAR